MIVNDWYNQLIEELKDIIVEAEFTSRWALIEGYHSLGTRILQEYENFQRIRLPDSELVQRIAISLGKRKRTIYYAIQFARAYPDLNLLPEGKNISWHHVVNKYLTKGKDNVILKKSDLYKMIKDIKELLQVEWYKANQEGAESRKKFIRYLQDMVDKITSEVNNG